MLRLKLLGSRTEPNSPEAGINTLTITQLEQELINKLTNIFGATNLQMAIKYADFSKTITETNIMNVIADIAEAIRFCLSGIEENNIYLDIPNYFGEHYDSDDKKSLEYKMAVASHSMLQLTLLLHKHFIKDKRKMNFDFTNIYMQLLEIVNDYSLRMGIGACKLEETLEA